MISNFKINVNEQKNILYIYLDGYFRSEEIKKVVEQINIDLIKLKPGFDIINDIRKFKPGKPEDALNIKKVQEFLKSKGANRVVRIVEKNTGLNVGALQFKRLSAELGYDAVEVESLEEAEEYLLNK
ncbi:MAG: hypothetical protein A2X12_05280 [Bacteroidetes bacterium GWE2_29_8]|nr:MAG: hypothetical protein A2X12_05280 [Bacteroidetes bacterium GWE2_29_8]